MARGQGAGKHNRTAATRSRRAALEQALSIEDVTERLLEVAAIVGDELTETGLRPVVVGGLAVAYWTEAAVVSHDIDVLAPTTEAFVERLEALGFEPQGRHWVAPAGRAFLEAPGSFPDPGAKVVEVELPSGRSLLVLSLEDVLLDRLHQFRGGGHSDVYAQTIYLLALPELDRQRLDERAAAEGLGDALALVEASEAEFVGRGRPPELWELHELARRLP